MKGSRLAAWPPGAVQTSPCPVLSGVSLSEVGKCRWCLPGCSCRESAGQRLGRVLMGAPCATWVPPGVRPAVGGQTGRQQGPQGSLTSLGACSAPVFVTCHVRYWNLSPESALQSQGKSQKGECHGDQSRRLMSDDSGLQRERT